MTNFLAILSTQQFYVNFLTILSALQYYVKVTTPSGASFIANQTWPKSYPTSLLVILVIGSFWAGSGADLMVVNVCYEACFFGSIPGVQSNRYNTLPIRCDVCASIPSQCWIVETQCAVIDRWNNNCSLISPNLCITLLAILSTLCLVCNLMLRSLLL